MNERDVKPNVVLIRELLTKQDMNIKQLAEKVGISREAMSKLVNAKAAMSLSRLQQVADVLNVPYQSLLSTTEELLIRRFEQILIRFSLSERVVEAKLPEVLDMAVRLGFLREVSPWESAEAKSDAQSAIESEILNL